MKYNEINAYNVNKEKEYKWTYVDWIDPNNNETSVGKLYYKVDQQRVDSSSLVGKVENELSSITSSMISYLLKIPNYKKKYLQIAQDIEDGILKTSRFK